MELGRGIWRCLTPSQDRCGWVGDHHFNHRWRIASGTLCGTLCIALGLLVEAGALIPLI